MKRRARRNPPTLVSRRLRTREELSRVLVAYGAFALSGKILDGDDRATLSHLRRLRAKLASDERGEAMGRIIRALEKLRRHERSLKRAG